MRLVYTGPHAIFLVYVPVAPDPLSTYILASWNVEAGRLRQHWHIGYVLLRQKDIQIHKKCTEPSTDYTLYQPLYD